MDDRYSSSKMEISALSSQPIHIIEAKTMIADFLCHEGVEHNNRGIRIHDQHSTNKKMISNQRIVDDEILSRLDSLCRLLP